MPSILRRCRPGTRLGGAGAAAAAAGAAWVAVRRACKRVTRRGGPTSAETCAGAGSAAGPAALTSAEARIACLGGTVRLPCPATLVGDARRARCGGGCPAAASSSTAASSRARPARRMLRSGPWCLLGGGCTSRSARHIGQVNLPPPQLLCCCSQASRQEACTQCEQGSCLPACRERQQGGGSGKPQRWAVHLRCPAFMPRQAHKRFPLFPPTPALPAHHPNAHRHGVQADGADLTLQPSRCRLREGMRQRVLQAAVARVPRQTLLQRAQHVAHLRG